jgi:hypothetical protein
MDVPSRGVMLLVAAPARNWRDDPAGFAVPAGCAAKPPTAAERPTPRITPGKCPRHKVRIVLPAAVQVAQPGLSRHSERRRHCSVSTGGQSSARPCVPTVAFPLSPKWPKPGKAAFRPFTVSRAYITRPGGGWRCPREPQSYPRRVSGACPARVRRVSRESPRLPQPVWLMQLGFLSATCRQASPPP